MPHPLFTSKNGAILYAELPEVMRLYDNQEAGRLGDLEAFLYGFGHMLDRFEATLEQFYADAVLEETNLSGDATTIQGWLLPYMAQLFGVELVAPDPQSRRRELATSIWVAKRRGTKAAIDQAAESLLDTPVVVVEGSSRVLRTPRLSRSMSTQKEAVGLWHQKDENILGQPIDPFDPLTHVADFYGSQAKNHFTIPVGTPISRRRMRAVAGGINRADADVRPILSSDATDAIASFYVTDTRGAPCFPDSYEDRSMRTPDMRRPRSARPRFTTLAKPDAVQLFVRPPTGFFHEAMMTRTTKPQVTSGEFVLPATLLGDVAPRDVFFKNQTRIVDLDDTNKGADGTHQIEDLKFAGTLRVSNNTTVSLRNCAVRRLLFRPTYSGQKLYARNCLFDEVVFLPSADVIDVEIIFEYVTVTGPTTLPTLQASDCLFSSLTLPGGDGEKIGCIRYSRVQNDFDGSQVHQHKVSIGPAGFLERACIEQEDGTLGQGIPAFGSAGYGVLADSNRAAVTNGAQDGGELGAYHDSYHLARLDAAVRKASRYVAAGKEVFATYDMRLAAPLPSLGE